MCSTVRKEMCNLVQSEALLYDHLYSKNYKSKDTLLTKIDDKVNNTKKTSGRSNWDCFNCPMCLDDLGVISCVNMVLLWR